jgi:predicted nuclease with TOPRIM domain
MSNSQEKILIITGMHRSGTSLTSSLLQSAGLDIGENLVPENEGNPKGHFENIEFVNFHETILYSLGINKIGWTVNPNIFVPPYYVDKARKLIEENSSSSGSWGWKEPRTTLFLDFWGNLVPEAKFIFVYRAPWEVIDSLYRRGDDVFDNHPEFALEIWNFYNKLIIDFYHNQPDRCLIIHINSIIKDPCWLIKTIANKFSMVLSEPDSSLCDLNLLKRQESQSHRPQIIKLHFPDTFQIYCDLNTIAQYNDPLLVELQKLSSHAWVLQDWLDAKRIQRKLKHEQENSTNHLEKVYQQLGESLGKVGELEYKLEQSQQESSQLHSQLEQSQQQSTQLHSQLKQSQQESSQLRSQLEQSQQEFEQLHSQLKQSQQESERLHSQLEQSQQESLQLRSQLAQSQRQSVQLVSQLEQSQQEFLQLRSQLAQSQQESTQLRSQLEQSHQESTQLRSQLTQSNERILAMETSKFWKIRKNWFKIKRTLGMKDNE